MNNCDLPDVYLHMLAVMLIAKTASFCAAHYKPGIQDADMQEPPSGCGLDPRSSQFTAYLLPQLGADLRKGRR